MAKIIIDRFSAGLDDLSRKGQRDVSKVLAVLHRTGRFSVFEASDNEVIARTMTSLMRGDLVENLGGQYPWTKVRLTEKGLAAIGEDSTSARSAGGEFDNEPPSTPENSHG